MLNRFPGRTLEELDGMDVLRVLRAAKVQEIDRVEAMRRLSMDKDGQKRLEPEDWKAIARHDRLMSRHGGETDGG